jgi:putative intracellular protease/amidase
MVSASHLLTMKDGSHYATGFWSEELHKPYRAFRDAGFAVDFATPAGHVPIPDQRSLQGEHQRKLDQVEGLDRPMALDDVDAASYVALYVPGGHAPLEDIASDQTAGRLLTEAIDLDRPVGALCHGPAALLTAKREDGSPTFAGYRVTGFTDQEEEQTGLASNMRYLVQDSLEAMGAYFVPGAAFEPHIENDRNLHTGQNSQSSALLAAGMLAAIESHLS